MIDARIRFGRWLDCLLDPRRSPQEHWDAAHAWCAWTLDVLGVDEKGLAAAGNAFFSRTRLSSGLAITPLGAARCLREHRRTAVFLQAMDEAIRAARTRFPGETIHVLEAGCGPAAPLSLPFACCYAPEEVSFTLLDLHPVALDGAQRIAEALGVTRSIRAYLAADATEIRFAEAERPHVIGCEVLLRALTNEPQVAATLNLAPQVRPGGFFLPGRIDVRAGLMDVGRHCRGLSGHAAPDEKETITELGGVFSLDAGGVEQLERRTPGELAAESVRVPPHDPERTPLRLFTRIQVFREHWLDDFDSSLNLPEPLAYPRSLAMQGGVAEFRYAISAYPGLRLTSTEARVRTCA